MTYALIRPVERTDEGAAFIVALERLDAVSEILGKAEIVAKVQGLLNLNCLAAIILTYIQDPSSRVLATVLSLPHLHQRLLPNPSRSSPLPM